MVIFVKDFQQEIINSIAISSLETRNDDTKLFIYKCLCYLIPSLQHHGVYIISNVNKQ